MPITQASKTSENRGFTLIELLVTLGLGLLVLGATVVIITSHLRAAAASERAQRVRDNSNRLNYFLQIEAGEAVSISTGQIISQCSPSPSSPSLFTLNIPLPSGTLAAISTTVNASPTTTPIHYFMSNGNLMRCGPGINQNGSLNLTTTNGSISYSSNIISSGTALTLTTCQGTTTNDRAVAYQASFTEATANGASPYQPPCEIARAKSFFVIDPP